MGVKTREHQVTHQYQPTNNCCAQTALAILISHYDIDTTAEDILQQMPTRKKDNGDDWGTIGQKLAAWPITKDLGVTVYSFDFQVLDLSWADLPAEKVLERLEAVRAFRDVPSLGREWTMDYTQAYIDLLNQGGKLIIKPYPASALLYNLLNNGPVMVCVSYNMLYNRGRTRVVELRKSVDDDLAGIVTNHFIVVYGNDVDGNFLVADPWEKPGRHIIEPERLVCAMTASQVECDNLWICLQKSNR